MINFSEKRAPPREIAELRLSDHVCLIYRTEEEHRAVLTEYLRQGLERGERVVYIADARSAEQIRNYLQEAGLDPLQAETRGQLLFLTASEAYLREGRFDPERMMAFLREEVEKALKEGFTGLRVTGEMTWALKSFPGSEHLIEYEARLSDFFPGSACIGLCQYDARRFPPEILREVLRTHPIVLAGTQLFQNFYFSPEDEAKKGAEKSRLDRELANLEKNERILASLRGDIDNLKMQVRLLQCLKRVQEIASREDLSIPEILAECVEAIRSGWRWPELAKVRIEYEGKVYASEGFQETPWRQSVPLKCEGQVVGKVEVVYPNPPPASEPFLPEEEELLSEIAFLLSQTIELRRKHERLIHFNAVLRAIRNVNQLIVREGNAQALIEETCRLLVEPPGYLFAWLVLLDEQGQPRLWASSEKGLEELVARWEREGPPICVQRALAEDEVAIFEKSADHCHGCPLAIWKAPATVLAVEIRREREPYGVLVVGVPPQFATERAQLDLLREVASDLAEALYAIALKEKHRELDESRVELVERLTVLHRVAQEVTQAIRDPEHIYEIIHRAVSELMPAEAFVISLRTGEGEAEAVYLWDKGGRWPKATIPYGEGLTWHVVNTGRPVLVKDTQVEKIPGIHFGSEEPVRSLIAAPLRIEERIVGMVSAQSYKPSAYTEEDLKILEMLASHTAVAIENARLWAALKESEEKFRELVEDVGDVIVSMDAEGKLTYVSPAVEELTGHRPEELVGQFFADFVHPEDRNRTVEGFKRAFSEQPEPFEHRIITKDGKTVWVRSYGRPFYEEGKPAGFRGVVSDISGRKKVEEELRQSYARIERLFDEIVRVLSSAIELRDPYTAGHQRRVAELARAIAEEMGLSKDQVHGLWIAAILHDIGKALAVPIEILSKPGKLTEQEMGLIRQHPRAGYEVLKDVEFPWPVAEIVYQHHERLDGSGYPRGLKGEEILLEARILAVADVVEAMSSHRPYRPALGIEAALSELEKGKGKLYDPAVVDACLTLFRKKGFDFSEAGPPPRS